MKPERAPDLQPGGFVHSPTLALVAGPGIEPGPPAYETGWGTCPSPATIGGSVGTRAYNLLVDGRVSAPDLWFFGRDGWIRTNDRSLIRRLLYPRATSLW